LHQSSCLYEGRRTVVCLKEPSNYSPDIKKTKTLRKLHLKITLLEANVKDFVFGLAPGTGGISTLHLPVGWRKDAIISLLIMDTWGPSPAR